MKHIQPVNPAMLSFMIQHEDTTGTYTNTFLKVPPQNAEQEPYLYSAPEKPGDTTTYTPIQQRIYKEHLELKELKQLDLHDGITSRKTVFISNFDWSDTCSAQRNNNKSKQSASIIMIIFPDILWTNCEFKVSLLTMMTDLNIAKDCQYQSTLNTISQ